MYIQSPGVAGSFFYNWENAEAILCGREKFGPVQAESYKTTILKPIEARRTSETIKMVLQAAEESLEQSSFSAKQLYSVFVSSDGDPNILQSICQELASDDKFVSPTQFHNSVHNAPAGYWSIGNQSMKGANSLACGDSSLAGGLLEASSLLDTGEDAVLLVCFDLKSPAPLDSARLIRYSHACSMILTGSKMQDSIFSIRLEMRPANNDSAISTMSDPQMETVRCDSPATKCLPFLEALACSESRKLTLPYSGSVVLDLFLDSCAATPNY